MKSLSNLPRQVVAEGSRRWQSTAVGYFLGRRPYFPQLEAFARGEWKGLQQVSATVNGFFFFRFKTLAYMEEVIEEGPWLFQGQPVVFTAMGTGDVPASSKTSQSSRMDTVATSSDGVLDGGWAERSRQWRSPIISEGKEVPIKVDIEYEWLPLRCKQCCSLGHTVTACPELKKNQKPPVSVYVQKRQSKLGESSQGQGDDVAATCGQVGVHMDNCPTLPNKCIGDNVLLVQPHSIKISPPHRLLHCIKDPKLKTKLVRDKEIQFLGLLETRVRLGNVQSVRDGLLPSWSWFEDYSGPGGRIWLTWNALEVGVEILGVEEQCIHCCLLEKRSSTKCLTTVVYGDCESTRRRLLWAYLLSLSEGITDARGVFWGTSMLLLTLSTAQCEEFFALTIICPKQPGFLEAVRNVWQHQIYGNKIYAVVCKLKALKATFREQRKIKGNLSTNVSLAKEYLDKAQGLFDLFKDNTLFLLVQRCRAVYCKAVETEAIYVGWTAFEEILELGLSSDTTLLPRKSLLINCAWSPSLKLKRHSLIYLKIVRRGLMGIPRHFTKRLGGDSPDIIAAITEFFDSGRLLKQLNATTLVLIPKRVLHRLIDCSQNAFVPGRSIADNILLAQELLAGYNQVKLPNRCTIKVDIQKAYDSVHWDFILESLNIFNFPTRFISWVEQCMTTASFSVALNGHLESVRVIKATLEEFAGMSGLTVNPTKSTIILSKAVQRDRHRILEHMAFQEGTLPIRYLGVPLVSSRLTIAECQPLIGRITSRLAGWNHLTFSLAGRTQLLKSVITSLQMFWASVFILPKSVIQVSTEEEPIGGDDAAADDGDTAADAGQVEAETDRPMEFNLGEFLALATELWMLEMRMLSLPWLIEEAVDDEVWGWEYHAGYGTQARSLPSADSIPAARLEETIRNLIAAAPRPVPSPIAGAGEDGDEPVEAVPLLEAPPPRVLVQREEPMQTRVSSLGVVAADGTWPCAAAAARGSAPYRRWRPVDRRGRAKAGG
ncbi:UNVERIFIED_CONTAM: hypothetical protein Sradi_7176800 [Sesamum radiatum]|uniref:Reverse transcriptase domain-containing protein n=1 Tax=Sesamum radiatum TaxID=300843 RepID=A0AAW2ITI2_SESRA